MSVFILVLGFPFNLTPDDIYKSFSVAKIFAKKSFKFISKNKNVSLYFKCILTLILSPASIDTVLKKNSRKQDLIVVNSFSFVKIVFALLTKLIAI